MIFGRKKKQMLDPAFTAAEFRAELQRIVQSARAAGLRHYILAEILEQVAQEIKVRHETSRPPDYVGLDVSDVRRFLDRNSR
jgi:hypothetical protein